MTLTQNTIIYSKTLPILKNYVYILLGVLFLVVCSQLRIPLDPIPITLQTVGVMLIALTFKRNQAVKTILFYLTFGAIGVPVFSNFKSGMHCLLGPSGGYLFGFLVAVIIMASIKNHLNNYNVRHIAFNCLLGTSVILLCGVVWLAYYVGINTALKSGLYPFITAGIIKILFTTAIVLLLSKFRFGKYT